MGAPKGNTNALKHGLYAKHYSPEQQGSLRRMPPEDYRHELYLMRVVVNNIFEIHTRLHAGLVAQMTAGQTCDVEGLAKITNSLSLAITALNTTARTFALFNGTDRSVNDTFEQALASLTIFLEDDYVKENAGEIEDLGEVLVENG